MNVAALVFSALMAFLLAQSHARSDLNRCPPYWPPGYPCHHGPVPK